MLYPTHVQRAPRRATRGLTSNLLRQKGKSDFPIRRNLPTSSEGLRYGEAAALIVDRSIILFSHALCIFGACLYGVFSLWLDLNWIHICYKVRMAIFSDLVLFLENSFAMYSCNSHFIMLYAPQVSICSRLCVYKY